MSSKSCIYARNMCNTQPRETIFLRGSDAMTLPKLRPRLRAVRTRLHCDCCVDRAIRARSRYGLTHCRCCRCAPAVAQCLRRRTSDCPRHQRPLTSSPRRTMSRSLYPPSHLSSKINASFMGDNIYLGCKTVVQLCRYPCCTA